MIGVVLLATVIFGLSFGLRMYTESRPDLEETTCWIMAYLFGICVCWLIGYAARMDEVLR